MILKHSTATNYAYQYATKPDVDLANHRLAGRGVSLDVIFDQWENAHMWKHLFWRHARSYLVIGKKTYLPTLIRTIGSTRVICLAIYLCEYICFYSQTIHVSVLSLFLLALSKNVNKHCRKWIPLRCQSTNKQFYWQWFDPFTSSL